MKLEEIDISKPFLAKYYFNSKKITWQPCRVISKDIVKNKNGFDVIMVKFFDGTTKGLYANTNKTPGSRTIPDIKPMSESWLIKELGKINNQQTALSIRANQLMKTFYK